MKVKIKEKFSNVSIFSVIVFVLLAVYSICLLYMIFWALTTSVKTEDDYLFGGALSLPKTFDWSHYKVVYDEFVVEVTRNGEKYYYGVLDMLINSVIYAGVGSFIAALVPLVVSYITAKYDFWYCKVINTMVIVLLGVPIIGNTSSMIAVLNALGLYDSFVGLFVMSFGFVSIYYMIFYASWTGIPNAYREAAEIDGANDFTVMCRIMFPMMTKIFTTVLLMIFVSTWNDYQTPFLYAPSIPMLSRGVFVVTRSSGDNGVLSNTPTRMAAVMLILIPISIVFIVFNKKLMGNVSMGGLKE